jgi:hypothetical protein
VKRIADLIRSFWNYHFGTTDYRVWQCCKHDEGEYGHACQRFKGHIGKHRNYFGGEWP